jgi:hypothetical protein
MLNGQRTQSALSLFAVLGLLILPVSAAEPSPDLARYLGATWLINTDHPSIKATSARLVAGKTTDREKAIAIHNFVRDQIAYEFGPKFYDHQASEVLRSGRGFCNPKGTLFIALLRAAGIPARQHFVEISPKILHGIVDPGTAWIDHSYTEVWLEGSWVSVDSYIVDPALFAGARRHLDEDGRELGYGIHRHGNLVWDGRSANFSQYVSGPARRAIANRDFGVHEDVRSFYENTPDASNRMNVQMRTFFRFATTTLNARIRQLRHGGRETVPFAPFPHRR